MLLKPTDGLTDHELTCLFGLAATYSTPALSHMETFGGLWELSISKMHILVHTLHTLGVLTDAICRAEIQGTTYLSG